MTNSDVDELSKRMSGLGPADRRWPSPRQRLQGTERRLIWDLRRIAALEEIELALGIDTDSAVASIAAAKHVATGRLHLEGLEPDIPPSTPLTARFSVPDLDVRRGPRRYIPRDLGVEGFFRCLEEIDASYAVLRWFDELPDLPPGEDIDLLVDDDDVSYVEQLTDCAVDGIALDLYSVSGIPGTDYKGMAYYPPRLAATLLDETVLHEGRWRVPSPRHHFLSLAYHVVYHKGEDADLAPRHPDDDRGDSHDYEATLSGLADRLGIELESVTLEQLEAVVDEYGWSPPRDMQERLALRNPWLESKIEYVDDPVIHRGLSAFLIRERAVTEGHLDEIVDRLDRVGFSILAVDYLDDRARRRLARTTRGGNWGPGPWPVSGGPPAAIVVVFDVAPLEPTAWQQKQHPLLANARLLEKPRIRLDINRRLPKDERYNMLHSADHGSRGLEYVETWDGDQTAAVLRQIRDCHRRFTTDMPVLDVGPTDHLAKREVVEFRGRRALKKTFRPGKREFLEREVEAARRFAWRRPEFLPVLERGDNYLIYPCTDGRPAGAGGDGRLLSIDVARQVVDLLRFVYEQGFALINAGPSKLRFDPGSGLTIVDTSYLYEYETRPETFEQSFDIDGIPPRFDAPVPPGLDAASSGYQNVWRPVIGLDFRLVSDGDVALRDRLRRLPYAARRRRDRIESRIGPATTWVKHWMRQLDGLAGYFLMK